MPSFTRVSGWLRAAATYIRPIGTSHVSHIVSKLPRRVGVVVAVIAMAIFAEVAFSVSPKAETQVIYGGPAEPSLAPATPVRELSAVEATAGIFDEELS